MSKNLNNKVAVVTGATRGIGRAITENFLKNGAKVIGIYKQRDDLAKEFKHKNLTLLKADISTEQGIDKVTRFVKKELDIVDILINNAGIFLWGKIESFSLSDWNKLFDTNLKAYFLMSRLCIPYLKKSTDGVIINISSRVGINEYTSPEIIAYAATYAGVNNFTIGLSKELIKEKIRVNAVIPTITDTDRFRDTFTKEEQAEIIANGKLGTPAEVAENVYSLVIDTKTSGEILIDERVF